MEAAQSIPPRILLVDDEDAVRNELATELSKQGYDCVAADGAEAGLAALTPETDLVLARLNMMGSDEGKGGLWLVEEAHRRQPDTWILVLSEEGETARVIDCLKAGAAAWLPRPPRGTELVRGIERTLAKRRIEFARRKYQRRLADRIR